MKTTRLTPILSLFALTLASCATAPPPPPVQRSPALSLKPIADSNTRIRAKATSIGDLNEKTRDALDRAIVGLHQAAEEARAKEIDRARLQKAVQDALTAAEAAKVTADRLQAEKDELLKETGAQAASTALLQDQADKDHALAEKNANLADERGAANAKYVAREKEDDRWWGWHGVLRSIGHAIWRSAWHLFLWVGLPLLGILALLVVLNMALPGLPIVTRILGALAKIPAALVRALSSLWPFKKKPPPPTL